MISTMQTRNDGKSNAFSNVLQNYDHGIAIHSNGLQGNMREFRAAGTGVETRMAINSASYIAVQVNGLRENPRDFPAAEPGVRGPALLTNSAARKPVPVGGFRGISRLFLYAGVGVTAPGSMTENESRRNCVRSSGLDGPRRGFSGKGNGLPQPGQGNYATTTRARARSVTHSYVEISIPAMHNYGVRA